MSNEDPMFSSRTDEELLRLYNGMIATARDAGVEHDPISQFKNRQHLIDECQSLHDQLQVQKSGATEPAQGVTDPPKKKGGPGKKRLDASPVAEEIRQKTLADQERARREAESRVSSRRPKTAAKESTMPNAASANAKTAKPARGAKAAAPKKAAEKKAAQTAARTPAAPRAARVAPDAVIKVVVDENPRRAGTVQHERFALLMKFNGKTVEEFMKKGGDRSALNYAIEQGHVTAK